MKTDKMDIRKVKKLIEMLEESEVSEIEIHEGEESVRISRFGTVPEHAQTVVHVPANELRQTTNIASQIIDSSRPEVVDESREIEGNYIRAPMVGIFYSSPGPDKAPFLEHGKEVKIGDVVCIIEAMKIMNQIEADARGIVSRVMVENGDPVEFGQPLFLIREA
ncbi:MAG: acetyl-CoA carboxylase biotin carboxyl carrier protein [Gammaproteobacteria bacterium]